MRQSLVIGNWKMHGSRADNKALLAALLEQLPADSGVRYGVCPSLVHLAEAAQQLAGSPIALGAQNLCAESSDSGAYTGEVSAGMLKEYDVTYVLAGHSERRALYREDDSVVAEKFSRAQQAGLTPVLCVGEQLAEREAGKTLAIVSGQLQSVLDKTGIAAFANAVIAYEPVWAIGTGKTAGPDEAQAVHAHIRQWLAQHDDKIAAGMPLLYGGSVKAANAAGLFAMADIDGALVGGAALKADEFIAICNAAAE